ncbi:SOS response-associated peptidase family protein [Chitinibacter bivalviorum]|uniref:Abasic site processing protein n=1 Tax=Chitinibacter bivalviorum TaxID=2739434 RepID=A0A7H9BLN6_9NEIS|nr:SOS response-associated peptidase family protein [Chitinibacter bivalviorum]QLG88334.1 SOS response-associated peptidase family protein [Chitinibacter bivalviorum]
MCVNYLTVPKRTLITHFDASAPDEDWREEVWQDYAAPILIAGDLARQTIVANYGFLPQRKLPTGTRYSTMNARAETIGQLKSYRSAWHATQFCLIPMQGFFEPCYESGKAERQLIQLASGEPFAVAGIWREWQEENGKISHSFTQITINADQHPLMKRMHKANEEKRSLVLIEERDYDAWLDCQKPELARTLLRHTAIEQLQAIATPKASVRKQDSLF